MSKKENNKSPWINLQIKINLDVCLTRQVLFEKQPSPEKSKQIEMTEFFMSKLNNCELFINKNYPDYIFYGKRENNGTESSEKIEILFEKNEKTKTIYIKYTDLWQVFESKYGLNYTDVQTFTTNQFDDPLKSQGYKTSCEWLGIHSLV